MRLFITNLSVFLKKEFSRVRNNPARVALFGTVLLLCVVVLAILFLPPRSLNSERFVVIPEGVSLKETSKILEQKQAVRFAGLFRFLTYASGGARKVKAGEYFFDQPDSLFKVVSRVRRGYFETPLESVTIPEGVSVREIGGIFSRTFNNFDEERFLELAQKDEGYLFPDTYRFRGDETAESIVLTMLENFDAKVATISDKLEKFGRPLKDIIIMASIIEEEARTLTTRRMIAGILWKRLSIGMPLQVDAVFPYIIGKNTFELSLEDLKVDSPYNTYKYVGLPPTPITNPGLDAILATITPTKSSYFYYLSDDKGEMHYAKTHGEHLINKALFIHRGN